MGGAAVADAPIRQASAEDAAAIARIQVESWRTAYASILPASFLASLSVDDRAARWRNRIGPLAHDDSPTFVICDAAGDVRGFVHSGPTRDADADLEGSAELYTVYVDPATWRSGYGRTLMAATDEFWAARGVDLLSLWVFERNAGARAFYERLGWQRDGATQVDDFGGAHAVEVRYRRRLSPGDRP